MLARLRLALGRSSMYRLVLYYLAGLVVVAIVAAAFRVLPASPTRLLGSAAYMALVCFISNLVLARLWRVQANSESQYITALILALIFGPIAGTADLWRFALAGTAAMGSKYLLAFSRRHVFNPAAFGSVALLALAGYPSPWWLGSQPFLLPLIIVGGLLLVLRIRRFELVGAFLLGYLALLAMSLLPRGLPLALAVFANPATYTSIVFLGTVMLVEPLTGPAGRGLRLAYGIGVAALLTLLQHLPVPVPDALELALLSGNLLARLARPSPRLDLSLVRKEQLAPDIMGFWFEPSRPFQFQPGQFLEWSLPHPHPDASGTRRFFTIASSPTEPELLLATRVPAQPSSFKAALRDLPAGSDVSAWGLDGSFTLPADRERPLAFIAGGIGITPFRSMLAYLLQRQEHRSIVLLYSARNEQDLVFRDLFDKAASIGLRTVYVPNVATSAGWHGRSGRIDAALIGAEVPDYAQRLFYISGPEAMVLAIEKLLADMGVKPANIKRDYFPGYAREQPAQVQPHLLAGP